MDTDISVGCEKLMLPFLFAGWLGCIAQGFLFLMLILMAFGYVQ